LQGRAETLCDRYGGITPDVVIGENDVSDTFASQLPTGNYQYQNIRINGTLHVDIPFMKFDFCNIQFGRGAQIVVNKHRELVIFRSNLFACQFMRKGIKAQLESKAKVNFCWVEDAQYAISADDQSVLTVVGTTFDRNYVGITNSSAGGGSSGLNFSDFHSNHFTCTSNLNVPYPGQTPSPGSISFAGLLLNQCTASIGIFQYPNTFSKMLYGIHATLSDVTIVRGVFREMELSGSVGGVGVRAVGGTMKIVGVYIPHLNDYVGGSVFTDCNFAGVYTQGTNLEVRNATFNGAQEIAVYSADNLYAENVHISLNEINLDDPESYLGIQIDRSVASGALAHNVVSENGIHMGGNEAGVFGIYTGAPFPAIDHMEIRENTVVVTSTAINLYPIAVEGGDADQFRILDNVVDFQSSNFGERRWGISMLGAYGYDHEINFNRIQGSGTHNPGHCGIHLDEAKNVSLCANRVNHTRYGLHFAGDNAPCTVRSNQIEAHEIGLLISLSLINQFSTPSIGLQLRHGNTWSTTPGDYTHFAAQCTTGVDPSFSRFFVELPPPSALFPAMISPSEGWFFIEPGPGNGACGGHSQKLSGAEENLLGGNLSEESLTAAGNWELEFGLMRKLWEHPGLREEIPGAQAFFNEQSNSPLGQLSGVVYGLKEALSIPGELQSQLDELRAQRSDILDELIALDNSAAASVEEEQQPGLAAAKQVLFEELAVLQEQETSLKGEIDAIRMEALQALYGQNQSINSTNSFETHHKAVNDYVIKKALGTAAVADDEAIREIALGVSPEEGGGAVLRARQWLSLREKIEFWGDVEIQEAGQGLAASQSDAPAPANEWRIAPNPAKDIFNIYFTKATSGTLKIFNAAGQQVFVRILEEEYTVSADSAAWPAGAYFVKLERQDGEVLTQRVIISH
jgi:hypothetical protein